MLAGDDVLSHFESSESKDSSNASDEDSSSAFDSPASEQDNSVPLSDTSPQATCAVSPDRIKRWTPKCDYQHKPRLNMHFPTIGDAFLYYTEYGGQCGFDVRKSTLKTNRKGKILAQYCSASMVETRIKIS